MQLKPRNFRYFRNGGQGSVEYILVIASIVLMLIWAFEEFHTSLFAFWQTLVKLIAA